MIDPLRANGCGASPPGDARAVVEPVDLRSVVDEPVAPRRRAPLIRRTDVYSQPVVDGRKLRDTTRTRLRDTLRELLRGRAEREELDVDGRLLVHAARGVRRSNTLAVLSPKGGVGKTTTTFVLGSAFASHLKLRTLAIDANPDFGTLAALAPDAWRVDRTLADLLEDLEQVQSASELRPYVSRLPTGLHVLAAPLHAEAMAAMTTEAYGVLLAFLGRFYDAILLDCGTGITDPLAQFAVRRADQVLVVTTPEFVTAQAVLGALEHLELDRSVVVLNQAQRDRAERQAVEARFGREGIGPRVVIPYDDQLRTMLDSATYALEGLERAVRLPIKRLGLTVAEQLV